MKRWFLKSAAVALLCLPACTRHTIKLEPIEIKPIHITMDINIKVNRELDSFFDGVEKRAADKVPESK